MSNNTVDAVNRDRALSQLSDRQIAIRDVFMRAVKIFNDTEQFLAINDLNYD